MRHFLALMPLLVLPVALVPPNVESESGLGITITDGRGCNVCSG